MNLPEVRNNCLLAVSGGADSMFLLHHYRNASNLHVAHVNYNIRPDSHLDMKLVAEYCDQYSIPFHSMETTTPPESNVEAWARDIRYDFFNSLIDSLNLDYIVTAHNYNDQVETFILRVERGTTLKGLACIHRDSGTLFRPLLDYPKDYIYSECKRLEIPYREDSTNTDTKYMRNWVRHVYLDDNVSGDSIHRIANTVQDIFPGILKMADCMLSDDIFWEGGCLFISKSVSPDMLAQIYVSQLLMTQGYSLTEKTFMRMFSEDPSTRHFEMGSGLKCNKRKKSWIIVEFP